MKILVTGGAGFIGSHFVDHQLNLYNDTEVVVLDSLTYAGTLENLADWIDNPRFTFIHGDTTQHADVANTFEQHKFDVVVNFAAETHVDRSISDATRFISTNITGTVTLLEAVRLNDVERYVQISTDEVYGSIASGSVDENAPLNPSSPYAASKAAADLLCKCFHTTYGVPVLIARSSNNYGPRQYPEKLIPLMIQKILKGEPLPIYGTGENIRQWSYVTDNASAIDLVMRNGTIGQIYNVGSPDHVSNIDLVNQLIEITTRNTAPPKAVINCVEDRLGHDFRYSVYTDRATSKLGWSPKIDFKTGLESTINWYLQNSRTTS